MSTNQNSRRNPARGLQLSLPLAPRTLRFNGIVLTPIFRDNQPWIRSADLARALGYGRKDKVTRLYQRNADEFMPDMTQVIEIVGTPEMGFSKNLVTKVRIFSLRGCHLLAMFASTPVSKAFRKWVLDELDRFGANTPALPAVPTPSAPLASPVSPYVFQGVPVRAKFIVGEPRFVLKDIYAALGLVYSSSGLKKGVYQLPTAWVRIISEHGPHNSHALTYISFPAVVKMATHTTGNRRMRAWELVRWLVDDVLEKVKPTSESIKESAQGVAESLNSFARALESSHMGQGVCHE